MIKFDDRFESMENYLWNVYSEFTGRFAEMMKENPEACKHSFKEWETLYPELHEAFKDTERFLEYTEKFLGYKKVNHEDRPHFVYVGDLEEKRKV